MVPGVKTDMMNYRRFCGIAAGMFWSVESGEGASVTNTPGGMSADERYRLDECSLEPIRTPGAIQPHGMLLAVHSDTFDVVSASDNCGVLVGIAAADLLGRPLAAVTGTDSIAELRRVVTDGGQAVNPVPVVVNRQRYDAIVHRSGDLVFIELEATIVSPDYQSAPALYGAIRRLATATTAESLWAEVARELRRLTQFDRVMVYHFHADGHGEVVAEERAEEMEPYLGLHYPASDIPSQARELYLTKLSRLIVSSAEEGSALISAPNPDGVPSFPLDLSRAELRSASPHHLQFMRNMGQVSTLSLSLIHNGELIGMITCAHRTAHRVPFALRQGLEILANQVALQLSSMTEIERLTRQVRIRSIRTQLIGQLSGSTDIGGALFDGRLNVLDLIPSDGVSLCLDGTITTMGSVPVADRVSEVTRRIVAGGGSGAFATHALSLDYPELGELLPDTAGLILVPLGVEGDYFAWFRQEISGTVDWLGDQTLRNRSTPLSPRNSFSSWTESVTGRAAPWDGLELEAAELCRDLEGVFLRRAESKLASLALHDALTGLPNRRLLMDRLEHALTKYARGEELALLFIDLDGFKAVNDTSGHDVGDALLAHAAKQILATTRAQDTVARLGGDEFVVLCENTTAEEADLVASRIVDAIRQPAFAGGHVISITASVGITSANLSFSAQDLLREADSAMYRAKARGRDQTSR